MKLLTTKFYPVHVDTRTIHIDPMKRERDVASKWGRGAAPCIGLRGAHLMSHPCYHDYTLRPTVTLASVAKNWEEEVARSSHLWKSAAVVILDTLRMNSPEKALVLLRRHRAQFGSMAVSASYGRAVKDVTELLSQQRQAS